MLDVVTLGEAMLLQAATHTGPLKAVTEFTEHTAGAETNVAVGLSRLGLRVGWASHLGDDAMGRSLLANFKREGLDCSHVTLCAGQHTGYMRKGRVDDGSDPPIEYHRQGSAASRIRPDDVDWHWFSHARHLHVTGVFAALSPSTLATTVHAMKTMRDSGKTVSFDPNIRPALWPDLRQMRSTLKHLAAMADWVLPGLSEGEQLTGQRGAADVAAFFRNMGATRVIVKLGLDGAYFDSALPHEGKDAVSAYPVLQVVDTVGAGDAFAAGLVSGLLEALPLQAAVRRAAWMGARAVQARGDTDGLPTRAELTAALL
jgi:2-dehydro-3-deoxygluconokinase